MQKTLAILLTLLTTLGFTALVQTPTQAKGTPAVSWSFVEDDVNSNEEPSLTYKVSGSPRGSKVVVQRIAGTARVWTTIKAVPRVASGSATLPAVPMGKHLYRIAILKDGEVLAAARRPLRSYGQVRVNKLLSANEGEAFPEGGTAETRDGTPFTYSISGSIGGFGTNKFHTFLGLGNSSCRSFTLSLLADDIYNSADETSTTDLRAAFETADPKAVSVPMGVVAPMNVSMRIGTAVNFAVQTPVIASYYADGFGNCFTGSGKIPRR